MSFFGQLFKYGVFAIFDSPVELKFFTQLSQAIGLDGFHFRWLKIKHHRDRLIQVLSRLGSLWRTFNAKKDGATVKDFEILRTFKTF